MTLKDWKNITAARTARYGGYKWKNKKNKKILTIYQGYHQYYWTLSLQVFHNNHLDEVDLYEGTKPDCKKYAKDYMKKH